MSLIKCLITCLSKHTAAKIVQTVFLDKLKINISYLKRKSMKNKALVKQFAYYQFAFYIIIVCLHEIRKRDRIFFCLFHYNNRTFVIIKQLNYICHFSVCLQGLFESSAVSHTFFELLQKPLQITPQRLLVFVVGNTLLINI